MRKLALLALAAGLLAAVVLPALAAPAKKAPAGNLYAKLDTTLGSITIKLFEKQAPITVANFVGLATGKKEYTDPKTGKKTKGHYYDGVLFHRVIPGFMVQTGSPISKDAMRAGTGGPGYTIPEEIDKSLTYNKAGMVGMARTSAPHSGGSQFFITVAPTPQLNGGYTIFGEVVKGQAVADSISKVARDTAPGSPTQDRPLKPVVLKKVTVYRAKSPK